MSRSRIAPVLLVLTVALAACQGPAVAVSPGPADSPATAVYVVRHGWHTRVAVRRADVSLADWPESRDVGDVAWLEVGWGDRDYYPKPDPPIWDAIDAVIRPTLAALHVGGFDPAPPEFLAGAPMVRVPVSARGVDGIARFVHAHYEQWDGRPVRIRPGQYEQSWFYLATGRYNAVFNNSNTWVARALQAAGVPVAVSRATTAGGVMEEARRFGAGAPVPG